MAIHSNCFFEFQIKKVFFYILFFFVVQLTHAQKIKYPPLPLDHSVTQEVVRIYEKIKRPLNNIAQYPHLNVITKRVRSVASYNFHTKTINIEEKAYDICSTLQGSQKDAVLAFLIGHELTHFLKETHRSLATKETHFLMTNKDLKTQVEIEHEADIYGAFFAYIAGFDIVSALPIFLERVYSEYPLIQENLKDYPTLSERKNSIYSICNKAETYANIFKAGNYLAASGKNWEAANCFDFILKDFKFPELYNNAGMCQLAAYLDIPTASNHTKFGYPMTLDFNSPVRSGANADEKREDLLQQATENFSAAIRLNPHYFPAHLNSFCAKIASDNFSNAEIPLKNLYEQFPSNCQKARIKIAEGILRARQHKIDAATLAFKEARSLCKLEPVKTLAKWNIKVLKEGSSNLPIWSGITFCKPIDEIDLNYGPKLSFDTDLIIKSKNDITQHLRMAQLKHSFITQFFATSGNQNRNLVIQRSTSTCKCEDFSTNKTVYFQPRMTIEQIEKLFSHLTEPKVISGTLGYFLVYREHPIIFQFNHQNNLIEWAFYASY